MIWASYNYAASLCSTRDRDSQQILAVVLHLVCNLWTIKIESTEQHSNSPPLLTLFYYCTISTLFLIPCLELRTRKPIFQVKYKNTLLYSVFGHCFVTIRELKKKNHYYWQQYPAECEELHTSVIVLAQFSYPTRASEGLCDQCLCVCVYVNFFVEI